MVITFDRSRFAPYKSEYPVIHRLTEDITLINSLPNVEC